VRNLLICIAAVAALGAVVWSASYRHAKNGSEPSLSAADTFGSVPGVFRIASVGHYGSRTEDITTPDGYQRKNGEIRFLDRDATNAGGPAPTFIDMRDVRSIERVK
jgi:hypothetical protein